MLTLLVVLGHVFGMASHMGGVSSNDFFSLLRNSIYLFHMPAFFALSGLVYRGRCESFKTYLTKKTKRLLIPYFFFSVLSTGIYIVISGGFSSAVSISTDTYYSETHRAILPLWKQLIAILFASGWPSGVGFKMNSVLWFLPCLFVVDMYAYLSDRLFKKRYWKILNISAMVAIACVCIRYDNWMLPWGLMRVPEAFCYFIIGRYCIGRIEFRYSSASLLLVIGVIFCAAQAPDSWARKVSLLWYVAFTSFAILGIYASAWFSQFVKVRFLMTIGGASITIMMVHKYLIMGLLLKIPGAIAISQKGVVAFFAYTLLVSVVAVLGGLCANFVFRKYMPLCIGERRIK
ncbi:MAG: acyltransferase family protein [Kiritimatiellae bacterium]|nr:acyltransferase family protein [Kiritimatiellia bacterium]